MSSLFFTIMIAFIIVLLAVGLLAIGWLITGKTKIRPGACGRDPTKNRDEECSDEKISCGLCKKEDKK